MVICNQNSWHIQTQFQLANAHNTWKASWTREEAENTKKCSTTGFTQENADFDDCVNGKVVMNYTTPYDFNSIMHYSLTG